MVMMHKIEQAQSRLDSYLSGIDLHQDTVDTSVSKSDQILTIVLLSCLLGLILLNLIFYILYRRLKRVKLRVRDITLSISPPLSCSSEDFTAGNGGENNKAVSSSAVELRSVDGYIISHRSLSETELKCVP